MSWINNTVSNVLKSIWKPQITSVRFRYHADKEANGPLLRRYGYKETILQRGLLPRKDNGLALPIPTYR